MVFKSQGQVILSKAEAMGNSVGATHMGFMAEVQEEMQVCGLCALVLYKRASMTHRSAPLIAEEFY